MLMVVDCGNTNIVFALFDNDTLIGKWRTSTNQEKTSDDYVVWLEQIMSRNNINVSYIKGVIISSVVPEKNLIFDSLFNEYLSIKPLIIGQDELETGLLICIENPDELGADRIANSVAAYESYGGSIVIIDFGTATTFDVLDNSGNYCGGIIAPGINLSVDALYRSAALLPKISIKTIKSKNVIGNSTVSAMQSGIYWGYISLVEGLVNRIKQEKKEDFKVIATGGLAELFAESTQVINLTDSDLTIRGLVSIYKRNYK